MKERAIPIRTWRNPTKRPRASTVFCLLAFLLISGCSVTSPVATAPIATESYVAVETPGSSPEPVAGVRCGSERWPVKTLSDAGIDRVDFNPVPATISDLRALVAPRSLPQATRIPPTELAVFTVTARVVAFKLEDDKDIHTVISEPDDPAVTMIVEFPDADTCFGAVGSARAADMKAAREALVATFGQPSATRFVELSGMGTFTGVGFFDFLHGQRGVAPNGIELHPVIAFTGQNTAIAPR